MAILAARLSSIALLASLLTGCAPEQQATPTAAKPTAAKPAVPSPATSPAAGPALSPSPLASPAGSPSPAASPGAFREGEAVRLGDLLFNYRSTEDVSRETSLRMEADNFYFDPTFLRGAAGQSLTIEIENESSTLHSFTIREQQIDRDIPADGGEEVEITFPQSGVQLFYCKYHTAQGMNGELLVGDAQPQPVSR